MDICNIKCESGMSCIVQIRFDVSFKQWNSLEFIYPCVTVVML